MPKEQIAKWDKQVHKKVRFEQITLSHVSQAARRTSKIAERCQVMDVGHKAEQLPSSTVTDEKVFRMREMKLEGFQYGRHIQCAPFNK